jgi:hypothetical protein
MRTSPEKHVNIPAASLTPTSTLAFTPGPMAVAAASTPDELSAVAAAAVVAAYTAAKPLSAHGKVRPAGGSPLAAGGFAARRAMADAVPNNVGPAREVAAQAAAQAADASLVMSPSRSTRSPYGAGGADDVLGTSPRSRAQGARAPPSGMAPADGAVKSPSRQLIGDSADTSGARSGSFVQRSMCGPRRLAGRENGIVRQPQVRCSLRGLSFSFCPFCAFSVCVNL